MGRLVLIDAIARWFCWRHGFSTLRATTAARAHWRCTGWNRPVPAKGKVLDSRWLGVTLLQARFGFTAHWFDNARVTIRLRPRPIPFKWFVSIWHKQKETLTFEADLDYAPSFQLDVFRHRWLSQRHSNLTSELARLVGFSPRAGRSYHPHSMDPGTLAGGQHPDDRPRTQPDQRAFPFRIAPSCRHGSAGSSLRRAGRRWISERASRARRSISLTPVG